MGLAIFLHKIPNFTEIDVLWSKFTDCVHSSCKMVNDVLHVALLSSWIGILYNTWLIARIRCWQILILAHLLSFGVSHLVYPYIISN